MDRPGPATDHPGGPEPLTSCQRSCGLLIGLTGPPEMPTGLPELPEPLIGCPGLLELLAGRPGPLIPQTVRLEGCVSLASFLVPLTDSSGPELELLFWCLGTGPELCGQVVPVLGCPGLSLTCCLAA
jgi:hypothetical protein